MHCLFLSIFERFLIAGKFMEWFCHLVVFHPSTSRVANLTVCTSAWSALRDQVTTFHLLVIKLRHNMVWVLWISDRSAWTSLKVKKQLKKKTTEKHSKPTKTRLCSNYMAARYGLLSYVMALCSLLSALCVKWKDKMHVHPFTLSRGGSEWRGLVTQS